LSGLNAKKKLSANSRSITLSWVHFSALEKEGGKRSYRTKSLVREEGLSLRSGFSLENPSDLEENIHNASPHGYFDENLGKPGQTLMIFTPTTQPPCSAQP
jgi:hypothetical protein